MESDDSFVNNFYYQNGLCNAQPSPVYCASFAKDFACHYQQQEYYSHQNSSPNSEHSVYSVNGPLSHRFYEGTHEAPWSVDGRFCNINQMGFSPSPALEFNQGSSENIAAIHTDLLHSSDDSIGKKFESYFILQLARKGNAAFWICKKVAVLTESVFFVP